MTVRNYILATAGHVDHGKSALVKALTGSDPDRLPEEKARGITIDLGFAHLRLPPTSAHRSPSEVLQAGSAGADGDARLQDGCPTDELELDVGIVDVPGHEDFVKNMVAGIGAIDAALFVVAADDGWMPQSEEHLQILEYAGVRHGVIALTKIDRIEPVQRDAAIAAVRSMLAQGGFPDLPIVPTSVVTGEGVETLRSELAGCLARCPGPRDLGKPRLWVDRAFSLRGVGTVVTGSLRGGEFEAGQVVAVSGRGVPARIRTIHQHNAARPKAVPGTRTALNLMGLSAADDGHGGVIGRGDVVTLAGRDAVFDTCDVLLARSAGTAHVRGPDRPLLHGTTARLHVGTASAPCRIILSGRTALRRGESTVAQLRLESPLPLVDGEHVILRDAAERATLAGGVILDVGSSRKRFRGAAQQAFLAAQADHPEDCRASVQATLRRDGFAAVDELRQVWRFADAEIGAVVDQLVGTGVAVRGKGWVGLKDWWSALKEGAAQRIAAHERRHPTQNGLPLAQLRTGLGNRLSTEVFQALVAELAADAFEIVGAAIRHRSFRPSLPPTLQLAAAELSATLWRARLNPPARKDLARTAAVADALDFLIKTGRVIALNAEVAIAANVYHAAAQSVREHLTVHRLATVSELKQALGISRRVMVPLLEQMDRDGLTLRDGEFRVLRQAPAVDRGVESPALTSDGT